MHPTTQNQLQHRRHVIPITAKKGPAQTPYPILERFLLHSPHHQHVRFLPDRNQFWYRPDPQGQPDHWKRIYGLTRMLFHVFWPTYDRKDPFIVATTQRLKKNYYSERQKQIRSVSTRRQRRQKKRGGKTTAEIEALAMAKPAEKFGTDLGELVHKQLHVWAMDRFTGAPKRGQEQFGRDPRVEWPPNPRTMAVIRALIQGQAIDVRYGEMMIYDPRVPVATSVDLLGWSRRRQSLVVIEIKTGSKWNHKVGNGPMLGRAASVLNLNNAPWNQALVQLATTTAIVQERYQVPLDRIDGLLVWTNRWLPPPSSATTTLSTASEEKQVRVDQAWLDPKLKRAGRIMLRELSQHLARNSGKPWGSK